jgi:hypothetical protein
VLIYSCGGGSMRNDNTVLALELASHGYIVVSAEHADDAAMRMPDGRIVFGASDANSVPTYKSRRLDLGIVLSELEELNATDEVFGQHLDLDHVGVFGASTGDVAAAQLCQEEDRVKAGVLLDPGFISYVPNLAKVGIRIPIVVITGAFDDGRQLFNKAAGTRLLV